MKPLHWYDDALKDLLRGWPEDVRRNFGHQLRDVQNGEFPAAAKWMQDIGEGVIQLKSKGFRTVITICTEDAIWVIHAFEKDSARGKKTRKRHLELIKRRLSDLQARYIGSGRTH